MKKIFLSAAAVILAVSSASCGKIVKQAGENPDKSAYPIIAEPPTEPPTDPPTEEPTEPPTEPYSVDPAMPEDYELPDSCIIEGFETVMQKPELPAGCEITSLTQTLNFYGFDVDKVTMCDDFMPVDMHAHYTMDDVYLGDPRAENGFGCNAPVLRKAADSYFECIGSDWFALDLTGISLKEVFYQIDQGRPVVVWSTIGQRESHAVYQFRLGCGEDFYFNGYQHCLTIYGYDYNSGTVFVADPLVGNSEYDLARFERIYDEMGDQAVILCGPPETAGAEFRDKDEQQEWLEENTPSYPAELDKLERPEKKEDDE